MDVSQLVFANIVTILESLEPQEAAPFRLRDDVAQMLQAIWRGRPPGRIIKSDREPIKPTPYRELGLALAA